MKCNTCGKRMKFIGIEKSENVPGIKYRVSICLHCEYGIPALQMIRKRIKFTPNECQTGILRFKNTNIE